jgi:HTH-type transcriptional regulator/antitoxin HigA
MTSALDFSTPHLLRDSAEYESALQEVEALLAKDPAAGSPDHERLEFLAILIETYEDRQFPIEAPSPQVLVDFMLEQRGMVRADLPAIMGGKARVSEFFSGKRTLSIRQVRSLRETLGIPADLLL